MFHQLRYRVAPTRYREVRGCHTQKWDLPSSDLWKVRKTPDMPCARCGKNSQGGVNRAFRAPKRCGRVESIPFLGLEDPTARYTSWYVL